MGPGMPAGKSFGWRWIPARIAALFLIVGGLWVLLSDRILLRLVADPHSLTRLQTYKGWFFIAATSALIYGLVRRNVAQMRRHGEDLSRSRDYYLSLFEEFPTPIWRAGPDGRRTVFNGTWLRFTGRTPEQEAGDGWTRGVHPEDLAEHMGRYAVAVERRLPFEGEYRLRRRDGEYRWVVEYGKPVRGIDGRFEGFIGACYDLTDRKRQEEETTRANMLEALGVLAGGIAHDFNNLLTGILGNLSLARRHPDLPREPGRNLAEAEEAARRAAELTGQLLTFSSGGAPVRKAADAGGLVRAAAAALEGPDVRIDVDAPEDLREIHVDEGQIVRAMGSVILNAVQATPRGGIVRVRAENVSIGPGDPLPLAEGEYVQVTVTDEGPGIPRENLPHIFAPFFTTKERRLGMGLATAYSIVRRHDGLITVDSAPGGGTTVAIRLPACREEARWRDAGEDEEPGMGRGRVLVMDDEEMVRDVARSMLEAMDYEVVTARDGTEAIALFREARESGAPFDILIMDLTVPGGMGGKDAIARLMEIAPDVKAIVSSGYSNDPVMAEHQRYGFRGMIAKPYNFAEMQRAVQEVLRNAA